jgi:hypothetical protein
MDKYRYHIIDLYPDWTLHERLNVYGDQGWRVVAVTDDRVILEKKEDDNE